MGKRKFLSFTLLLLGALLLINSRDNITGAVIGVEIRPSISLTAGLLALIASVLLTKTIEERAREDEESKYYRKRAHEIAESDIDSFIAQWEFSGLEKHFKKDNFHLRGPEAEWGGYKKGPYRRHIKLEGYNKNGRYIRKHLFLTPDPYDERLFKKNTRKPQKYERTRYDPQERTRHYGEIAGVAEYKDKSKKDAKGIKQFGGGKSKGEESSGVKEHSKA